MSALLGRRRSELMIDDATPVEEVVELSEGADEGKESNGMPGGASTSSSMISVCVLLCSVVCSIFTLWPLFLGVLLWQNEGNCVKTTSGVC